jgi:hypothetical protein
VLVSIRSELDALAVNGAFFGKLTATAHEAQMVLFKEHLNDGVDEFLSHGVEYVRRTLQRCCGRALATAKTAASAMSEERSWDEELQALKDATNVCGPGMLARSCAGDGLCTSFYSDFERAGLATRVRGIAVRAQLRTLRAGCGWSDVLLSLVIADASARTAPVEESSMM